MHIKHAIIIPTYNQEYYIRDTLDSIFLQSVLPHKVIIADDASTDSTRKIIDEYYLKYPDIIQKIFHDKNLGVNENLNYILTNLRIDSDLIHFLDGDDLFDNDGLFKINQFIHNQNINFKRDKWMILTNLTHLIGDVKEIANNNYKYKDLDKKNLIKLKIRSLIGNRFTCISNELYKTIKPYNIEVGLWADSIISLDLYLNCDKFYFLNDTLPIYRIGTGVTHTKKKIIFYESWIKVIDYIIQNRKEFIDQDDINYLIMTKLQAHLFIKFNFIYFIYFIYYKLLTIGEVNIYTTYWGYLRDFQFLLPNGILSYLKKIYRGFTHG